MCSGVSCGEASGYVLATLIPGDRAHSQPSQPDVLARLGQAEKPLAQKGAQEGLCPQWKEGLSPTRPFLQCPCCLLLLPLPCLPSTGLPKAQLSPIHLSPVTVIKSDLQWGKNSIFRIARY